MALVLGRKPGEKIIVEHLGERMEIEVIKTEDGMLRLSIEANRNFQILREELDSGSDS
ncbi:carbon storage regulator [Virgibacillus sediminis]|uniref:Carbon storage regulator n=1 Tax=Virgibacillus sediminis TaxID=202260 RepID=A0ABV7A434_9BACI